MPIHDRELPREMASMVYCVCRSLAAERFADMSAFENRQGTCIGAMCIIYPRLFFALCLNAYIRGVGMIHHPLHLWGQESVGTGVSSSSMNPLMC